MTTKQLIKLKKQLRADLANEFAKVKACQEANDRTGMELARIQIKLIQRELDIV
jgi:hypothetical protein